MSFIIPKQLDETKDLSKLTEALQGVDDPDDRLEAIRKFVADNKIVYKERSNRAEPLPSHIMDVSPHSAIVVSSADKIPLDHTIRIVYGMMSGGPYSLFGASVNANGTLGQPVVARIENLLPNTTYYFVLQVLKDGEVLQETPELSFATSSYNLHPEKEGDVKPTTASFAGTAALIPGGREMVLGYREEGSDKYAIAKRVPGNRAAIQKLYATVKDLKPGTKYYYSLCVLDEKGRNVEDSRERSFTTPVSRAVVNPVTGILATSSMASGYVDFVQHDDTVELILDGEDAPRVTAVGLDAPEQVISAHLLDLKPETKYKYRIRVVKGDKVLYESETESFTTAAFNLQALDADPKASTAYVTGSVENIGHHESLVMYVNGDPVGQSRGGSFIRVALKDLTPNTEYEYSVGVGEYRSKPKTFRTKSFSPQSIGAVSVGDRIATLMGFADFVPAQIFGRFSWGRDEGQTEDRSQLLFGDNVETQPFAFMAYGLSPKTTYYYRLEILASDGETVLDVSEDSSFTTGEALRMR